MQKAWGLFTKKTQMKKQFLSKGTPNYAFEADAVKRRAVSCCVRAPRGSTRRWVAKQDK